MCNGIIIPFPYPRLSSARAAANCKQMNSGYKIEPLAFCLIISEFEDLFAIKPTSHNNYTDVPGDSHAGADFRLI